MRSTGILHSYSYPITEVLIHSFTNRMGNFMGWRLVGCFNTLMDNFFEQLIDEYIDYCNVGLLSY